MPFKSTAQQRFMYSQHPDIAARWTKEMKQGKKGYAKEHPIMAADLPGHVGKSWLPQTSSAGKRITVESLLEHRDHAQPRMPMESTVGRRIDVSKGQGRPITGAVAKGVFTMPAETLATVAGGRGKQALKGAGEEAAQHVWSGALKSVPTAPKPAVKTMAAQGYPKAPPVKNKAPVAKADDYFEDRKILTPRQKESLEARRQRRQGAEEGAMGVGGATLASLGGRDIVRATGRARGMKIYQERGEHTPEQKARMAADPKLKLGKPGIPGTAFGQKPETAAVMHSLKRGSTVVPHRGAGKVAAGLGLLGTAVALHRHGGSRGNRSWK